MVSLINSLSRIGIRFFKDHQVRKIFSGIQNFGAKIKDWIWAKVYNFVNTISWVMTKVCKLSPILCDSLKVLFAFGLSIWFFTQWPILLIGLATVPVVKLFKDEYIKVIAGFMTAILGFYFMTNGIFWIGDILILFGAINFLDMFNLWNLRVKEAVNKAQVQTV